MKTCPLPLVFYTCVTHLMAGWRDGTLPAQCSAFSPLVPVFSSLLSYPDVLSHQILPFSFFLIKDISQVKTNQRNSYLQMSKMQIFGNLSYLVKIFSCVVYLMFLRDYFCSSCMFPTNCNRPPAYTHASPPLPVSIIHWNGLCIMIDNPKLTHHCQPKLIIFIRVFYHGAG